MHFNKFCCIVKSDLFNSNRFCPTTVKIILDGEMESNIADGTTMFLYGFLGNATYNTVYLTVFTNYPTANHTALAGIDFTCVLPLLLPLIV